MNAVTPFPPVREQALNDAWEALQDMHLRLQGNPKPFDDRQFMARLDRTHRCFVRAYEGAL
jgi:hypothetical protein